MDSRLFSACVCSNVENPTLFSMPSINAPHSKLLHFSLQSTCPPSTCSVLGTQHQMASFCSVHNSIPRGGVLELSSQKAGRHGHLSTPILGLWQDPEEGTGMAGSPDIAAVLSPGGWERYRDQSICCMWSIFEHEVRGFSFYCRCIACTQTSARHTGSHK